MQAIPNTSCSYLVGRCFLCSTFCIHSLEFLNFYPPLFPHGFLCIAYQPALLLTLPAREERGTGVICTGLPRFLSIYHLWWKARCGLLQSTRWFYPLFHSYRRREYFRKQNRILIANLGIFIVASFVVVVVFSAHLCESSSPAQDPLRQGLEDTLQNLQLIQLPGRFLHLLKLGSLWALHG